MKSPIKDSNQMIYESLWINENNDNDNIACDVCLHKDDNEDDEIVICEGCNAAVH